MSLNIIVNGAQGKMGKLACETLSNHPDFNLVAELSRQDDLRSAIHTTKADIVVDLTRADAVFKNSLAIIEEGASPVIGTSGLLDEQMAILREKCLQKNRGGIVVPNFSIAAVLMMRFAAQAAVWLQDVEIIEMHHPQKFDAPSGTALKTADLIAAAGNQSAVNNFRETLAGVRGGRYKNIAIHSLRLPGVLARQEVIFGNTGETLSLMHDSTDRACFMPGLILCCQKVSQLNNLYYGLDQLLN